MRTVHPCSIAASELVSDITVRIGTTKFYIHKVTDMLFFIHMTVLLCETIVQSACAVGDHVFFMWFDFTFS